MIEPELKLHLIDIFEQLREIRMRLEDNSLAKIDIKRSEPPLERGENPCVNISKQHKELLDKDYAKEDTSALGDKR